MPTQAVCPSCRSGYVSQLMCGTCGTDVPRGQAWCSRCEQPPVELVPPPSSLPFLPLLPGAQLPIPPLPSAGIVPREEERAIVPAKRHGGPPSPVEVTVEISAPAMRQYIAPNLPAGIRPHSAVPETYHQSRFGVSAEVTMAGQDAEILTEMGQVADLLHALAGRMNNLAGFMSSTRSCIKSCRSLATELMEEIEVRRGPQG